jgi:hypothetical protein
MRLVYRTGPHNFLVVSPDGIGAEQLPPRIIELVLDGQIDLFIVFVVISTILGDYVAEPRIFIRAQFHAIAGIFHLLREMIFGPLLSACEGRKDFRDALETPVRLLFAEAGGGGGRDGDGHFAEDGVVLCDLVPPKVDH